MTHAAHSTSSSVESILARFVATPASPQPLAALRIGVAAVLIGQAIALSANLLGLYGPQGVMPWEATAGLTHPAAPRLSWVVDALAPLGRPAEVCVRGLFATYFAALVLLLVGYQTRAAAVAAWLTHWMFKTAAVTSVYGVDAFAHMLLFYFMFMPVGAAWSVDWLLRGRPAAESSAARLALRVIQLHLAVVYLFGGVEKALGPDWWNGEAIWCALMRRDLCPFDMAWLAQYPWLPTLAGWGTLVVEAGYAVFIWPRATRRPWAVATIGLHVGIAIMMGLTSFAALMSVLTAGAFLVPAEPRPAMRPCEKPELPAAGLAHSSC